jgi:predicted lipoprotein with Yx(FWY)xxD motif
MQRDVYVAKQATHFWFSLLIFGALVLLLAACGSNSSSSGSGTSGTTPTATSAQNTTPTTSGYGRYGNGSTTPTASSSSNLIKTSTATVGGKSESILTNAQGMTLYYNTTDKPPTTVCSGGCAGAWPPLVASGSSAPTSATSLPGKLSVVADANGNQVAYNGHPLYTFSGDTGAGQTTGEGVGGIWHVAIPGLS